MTKKINGRIAAGFAMLCAMASMAHAEGTAYFTLPAGFSDNVTATIVGAAGSILVVLALMFAWRKTVKATNRS